MAPDREQEPASGDSQEKPVRVSAVGPAYNEQKLMSVIIDSKISVCVSWVLVN